MIICSVILLLGRQSSGARRKWLLFRIRFPRIIMRLFRPRISWLLWFLNLLTGAMGGRCLIMVNTMMKYSPAYFGLYAMHRRIVPTLHSSLPALAFLIYIANRRILCIPMTSQAL